MRPMLPRLAILLVGATALVGSADAARAAGWRSSFPAAAAEARKLNRPLLVHFYSDTCPPCKMMERTVLNQPETLGVLGTQVVGVKINGTYNRDLLQRFGIQRYPSDVLVSPDGRVLKMTNGGKNKATYLTWIGGGLGDFRRMQPKRTIVPPRLSTQTAIAKANPSTSPAVNAAAGIAADANATAPLLGMSGYSPVALTQTRKWKKGDQAFRCDHKGIVYYLQNAEELLTFSEHPEWFVPRLLGCDPVVLAKEDRATPGDLRFGAFFDGELYLFASNDTRTLFKTDPEKFSRQREVQRAEIVGGTIVR